MQLERPIGNIRRVGVLRGGPSYEYDVSLRSGGHILKSMPETFSAQDVFISRDGDWHVGGVVRSPERHLRQFDFVINALHGHYGEDGKIQRMLEIFGVPYTGSSSLASALAMNKELTKRTLKSHGINVPHHTVLRRDDFSHEAVKEIFQSFPLPSIVKPGTGGSSLGVRYVRNFNELQSAIEQALLYSNSAIIEEYINGQEAACGVLEGSGNDIYALHPVEIRWNDQPFFDYESKYDRSDNKILPSTFSRNDRKELQRLAIVAHEALGLRHYSMTDFIISPSRGIFAIETNSLPGLTETSIYPRALMSSGIGMSEFIEHISNMALIGKN